MNRVLRIPVHVPTLVVLALLYAGAVGAMWAVPHRTDGFGRMNMHQLYASVGRLATFGVIDRRLVDWYMAGPDWEANERSYESVVRESVAALTPVFLMWCLFGAWAVARIRGRGE